MSELNCTFFELGCDLVADIAGDANSDLTGDWVKLSDYTRAYVYLSKPAGTAGDDLSIKVNQATDNAGTSSKDLTFTRVWYRVGAWTAETAWTHVNLSTPTADLDLASVGGTDIGSDDAAAQVVVEIMAESLDADNGFTHAQVTYEGDDIGNALIINSQWIMCGGHYQSNTPTRPVG